MEAGKPLSILNPVPRKLAGPALLHQLVCQTGSCQSGFKDAAAAETSVAKRPALDYRGPDGTRVILSYDQLHHVVAVLAAEVSRALLGASSARSPGSPDNRTLPNDLDRSIHQYETKQLVVPVLIPQAPELYVALLAVLKAGGAFCPIQLDAPMDRIRFILDDVSADVVLTTKTMAAKLPSDRPIAVILVDDLQLFDSTQGNSRGQRDNPAVEFAPVKVPSPDDLAYVMYTSGSTGTPKGVGVPHIAATQSLLAHDCHIPAFERFLQFAAPTFDVSVFEIFFPLFRGATLVSASRAEMLNDLPAVLRSMNVDACELTPTVAGSLLRSRENAPSLRLLLTIGEMLTEPVVREFGTGPDRTSILWAMYGPTEAAIHCTLQPSLDGSASVRNIGFPLETVSAYIIEIADDDQSPQLPGKPRVVPRGEIGELALGGYQLASGYINRPEQTAAAFVNTEKFGQLYRTGDKARITENGVLECYGRISGGQVKLRGQRIELGEIEQAALRADGCLGSVAAVINGVLVVFCQIEKDGGIIANMEEKVLESCRSWLPRFMIPGDVVLLEDLPRLASGKVDRKHLNTVYESSPTLLPETAAPGIATSHDDLGRLLHRIAHDILGRSIDSTASLAVTGLDSLQSIRFAASLRSAGVDNISAVDVLEAKTLSDLHARVRQLQRTASGQNGLNPSFATNTVREFRRSHILDTADVISTLSSALQKRINEEDVELILECTSTQASMLAETLANPKAYCNWVELEFPKQYNEDEVASCFRRLIEKHQALRSGFAQQGGRLVQVVWWNARPGQVQLVETMMREFRLDTEESFLHPFSVEILKRSPSNYGCGVHALLHAHHVVYDGWSMDLMRADLEAMLKNEDANPGIPYSAVVEHYASISPTRKNEAEVFWAQSLNDFQPKSLPGVKTYHEADCRVISTAEILAGLDTAFIEKFSRNLGCATQVIFQAALAWLWSSFVGSSDIVMGTVTSGRTVSLDGIERVVGPCLQTVPVRVDMSRMRSVRDLLDTIHTTNRSLLAHAFLPLVEVKKAMGISPGQPLYDVLFVYQESLYSQTCSGSAVFEVAHQDYLETKLLWEVEPQQKSFSIRATFHSDVFPETLVAMFIQQFQCTVQYIVDNVESSLSSVYSGFPRELLSCHNMNFRAFDGCADLAQLFQATARQTPTKAAICFAASLHDEDVVECQTLTFDELNRLANRVARYLRSFGAAPGDAVAIIMEKSIPLYVGILSIVKAGCAYVPLLPSTPAARAKLIVEQAGVKLCLADRTTADSLGHHLPAQTLYLPNADLQSFHESDLSDVPINASRLANIIYTSGSTGVPKGVCVTQLNICSNLDVLSRIYPLREDGRLLQSCSQAFDVSVFEIFFTWIYGMCLCSATNDVLFDDLERAIRLLNITHLSMTPTVASLVDPTNTPSVEFLVTSGEPLTEKVARMWTKQLYQGYGPSETTNICTVKKMASGDVLRHLGFGFENTSSLVLAVGGFEVVPLGAEGELCFGGDQVTAGYLNLPSLSAEKFLEHPSYGRIYRSGDIGRMLPDGSLMITGRIDDQIKLRGQRIELNEISAVLQKSDLLSESVTLLVHHQDSDSEQLVSFFTLTELPPLSSAASSFRLLDPSQNPLLSTIEQLFSLLKSHLPSYMVPTYLIPISTVPLTPAGKVNKPLLKEMFQTLSKELLSTTSSASVKSRTVDEADNVQWTKLEETIVSAISTALGADDHFIGRWTPLGSLGLDSISAIYVSRLLYQASGKRLAISEILKNMSVAQLAQRLEDTTEMTSPARYSLNIFTSQFLTEVKKDLGELGLSFTKVLPCTPLQEAMLVSPVRGKTYVNRMLFRLRVHPNDLKSSWVQLCERHDILHTCFVTTDNPRHPIAQIVLKDYTPHWLDFASDVAENHVEGALNSINNLVERHLQLLASPVDSFQPPVSFAVLPQPDASFLSFVCHHALYDGEAISRLIFEVEELVNKRLLVPLTPPDFGPFLEQALALPDSTDDFWKKHLANYRPTLFSSKSSATETCCIFTNELDMPLSVIQGQAKQLGFSLLTACQSIWSCVLHILTDKDDICFGNVYSGRSLPLDGIEELVAPCFNTLPVRVDLSSTRSSKDLLTYFQALNPDIIRYQFTPLRQIQRQHLTGVRLFDCLLLLQQPQRPLDESIWTLERDDSDMEFPLVCELVPDHGRDVIRMRLHYDQKYISYDGIQLISGLFGHFARSVLQFSFSHVPRRTDLPIQTLMELESLNLTFDHAPEDMHEIEPGLPSIPEELWTRVESIIRSVLSDLAGVPEDRIKRDTTIYRLGLDSVRTVQIAAMLRKQGLPVSSVDVMEYPSCMRLARALAPTNSASSDETVGSTAASPSQALSGYPSTATSPPSLQAAYDFVHFRTLVQPVLDKNGFFMAGEIEAVFPCTPLQSGLLAEFLVSKGRHYFNFVTFRQNPSSVYGFSAGDLKRAWKHAAASIPMLRTGFIAIDNEKETHALPPFAMVQLAPNPVTENHSRIVVFNKSRGRNFSLEKWKADATHRTLNNLRLPPWQAAIVDNDDGTGPTCHLAILHALYDATSLRRILNKVWQFVVRNGDDAVEKSPPTELAVSDILRQAALSPPLPSDLAEAWKDKAAQVVVSTFPTLTPLKVATARVKIASRTSSQPYQNLTAAVKSAGFTFLAVLQAAWTRILSSYTGDASVVFGAVLSGRNSDATEASVFPCLSTLPVIAKNLADNRKLVEKMMDQIIFLHKSQHLPLTQIQKWLGRPDSRLFDTLLVYQFAERETQGVNPRLQPSQPWAIVDEVAVVDYPVSLEAIPRSTGSLDYQLTFDDSIIPEQHASILLRQFDSVVCHLVFQPDGNEDDLVSSDPGLYSVVPASEPAIPSEIKLLHEFVEVQAERCPNKTALQFVTSFDETGCPVSKEWSYEALNARGNKVAGLISRSSQPGSIVAVCFDKCPEAFFAILGVLKAGCSFVALDPSAPLARKLFILQDSDASLLLTDVGNSENTDSEMRLSGLEMRVPIVVIEETTLDVLQSADMEELISPRPATLPSDSCYCLYTSGTTGTPKGCTISHENAVQALLAFQKLFKGHWDINSRWLQFASFHFDVSVLEQYWTWSVGIVLVAAPRDLILEDLAGTISRLDITHIDLTPSLGRLLNPRDVPSLCRGVFITGGEPLKQEMLSSWGPTGAVHNFYGPTEATIGVTSYPQVPQNGRASNIGKQFPNVGTFIFRPGTQTPVLRGGVGELCVSGKLVGKGYLHRPDLTNERFPTLTEESRPGYGERVYRTGDLVRLLHDNCFDFLGRADDQVKLRGQRLEIGEINHATRLGLGSTVGDIATLVIRDEENKKDFLVSFIVTSQMADTGSPASNGKIPFKAISDDTASALSRQVQAACRERLPGYMVPTYVVRVPYIPLSPNNKAEGKELKRLFLSLSPEERIKATGAETSLPHRSALVQSTVCKTLLAVLSELGFLGKEDQPKSDASIFELGVDSISALRFARALKRAGLTATPSLVLSHPVISDLAAALESHKTRVDHGLVLEARLLVDACQHRHRSHICKELRIDSEQIDYIAPCSALQQGMISRSRSEQDQKHTYFNTFLFKLESSVSVEDLRRAWKKTINDNAILRTRFFSTRDGFVQAALKITEPRWRQFDVGDAEDLATALGNLHAVWVSENQEGDIVNPLELYSVAWRGESFVVLHIFHGLYDATSLNLILSQVVSAYGYDGVHNGHQSKAPTFLEALVHGPLQNHDSCRSFWENHLRDSVVRPFPILAKLAPTQTDVSVKRTISFSAEDKLRVALGVTHSALVQAVWVSVLQKIFNGSVTLGLVLSGRTLENLDGVEGVVGPLFNTLPFHAPKNPSETWASLSQTCHAFITKTLPFQQVALRDIQKWCSSGQPLFDVLFSFELREEADANQTIWLQTESSIQADYPLALEAVLDRSSTTNPDDSQAASLRLLVVAKGGFADEAGLDQILDDFESAVETMSEDPFATLFDIAEDPGIPMGNSASNTTQSKHQSTDVSTSRTGNAFTDCASFVWSSDAITIRREISLLAGVPEDSVNENTALLELGLDSVDTIKLSARCRSAGVHLTNSQLVRGQSISAFLMMIESESIKNRGGTGSVADEGGNGNTTVAEVSSQLRDHLAQLGRELSSVENVLPPTPLQESMIAEMIQSDFTRYFNHDVWELAQSTDISKLRSAWISLIHSSPILRTVFFHIDSPSFEFVYCQVVLRPDDVVQHITQQNIGSRDGLAAVMNDCAVKAKAGHGESGLFQLSFLYATSEKRWYLVISIAHALYDGISLERLHHLVKAVYENSSGGSLSYLESTSIDVEPASIYMRVLHHILLSSSPDADGFWRSFLAGAQPTHVKLQMKEPNAKVQQHTPVSVEATSSISASHLVDFCKTQATSMQVVGQACWATVLATLAESLDVIFGVVLSGRDTEGAEEILFPTMNTVPVRVVLHGTVHELLQYMQSNMESINEYQHYPLRKAQKAVTRSEHVNGRGVFNTLFIFQKRLEYDTTQQNARSKDNKSPLIIKSIQSASAIEYPICVEMEVVTSATREDTVVWRISCDNRYISHHAAALILHQLDLVLEFMILSASGPPGVSSILRFEDDGVSVCGLSPFQPALSRQNQEPGSQQGSYNDSQRDDANVQSWSEDEEAILSALSAVSGLPESSIQKTGQTLYHLGLDSISAIKVSSLLRNSKGISLSVRELLSAASIEEMATIAAAKKCDQQLDFHPSNSTHRQNSSSLQSHLVYIQADEAILNAGIDAAQIESVLPATAMQVHMVSVWQNSQGQVFFPEFHYQLKAVPGGRQTIFAAWRRLVSEFPVLRTVLLAAASMTWPLIQVVIKPASMTSHTHNDGLWPALPVLTNSLALLRVLPGIDGAAFFLTLKIHHALYDAVSLQTILKRFRQLCSTDGRPGDPTSQAEQGVVTAWVHLLEQQVSEATTEHHKQFWSRYFENSDNVTSNKSESDLPSQVTLPAQYHRVSYFQPAVLLDITRLRAMSAQHGISLQSLFFAAYAKTIHSRRNKGDLKKIEPDVVFGVYLANRADDANEQSNQSSNGLSAFPTLCLVPLLVASPGRQHILDIAAQIQKDIHSISTSKSTESLQAPLTAGLWQIEEWTGVRVDSFVNFLFSSFDAAEIKSSTDGAIELDELPSIDGMEDATMDKLDNFAEFAPHRYPALQNNTVRGAYEEAVDIEAAIRGSQLDIGVFGSARILGKNGAAEIVASLATILASAKDA